MNVAALWQCDYERLNPPTESLEVDNEYYDRIIDDPAWLWVGYIPTPRNRAAWFLYHVVHGLAMGYPVFKVLLYAACNTRPGDEA